VAFKVGRTSVGTTAALSHTGSVAGDYESQRAAMVREGVIVVDSLDDVVDVAAAVSLGSEPDGNRIGIFTFSGGLGISLADSMSGCGFEFPELSAQTADELREAMGPMTVAINPLDAPPNIYEGSIFRDGLISYAAAPEFDATVVVLMPVASQRLYQVIAGIDEARRQSVKPLYVCWFTGGSSRGPRRLMELGIPCFTSLRACTIAIRHAVDHRSESSSTSPARSPAPISTPPSETVEDVARSEWDSRSLLQRYGLPLCDARLVASPEAAQAAASEIGLPVVVKGISAKLTHKGRSGLVRVGLRSSEEVHKAYIEITDRLADLDASSPSLAMIQPMISADVEVMIGLRMDPELGPVVVFGQGGVLTELLGDHATDLAPRDATDAERLILATRIGRALKQGSAAWPTIRDQVVGALMGLGAVARSGEPLTTIELNPLRVSLSGPVVAVDALVVGRAVS
jgi:acyl-CoA synthetase (NDP forming)